MILLREYNLLFIKTRKTAGTSVELEMRRHSSDQRDILTPVTPDDEVLASSLGLSPPRNWAEPVPLRDLRLRAIGRAIKRREWPPQRRRFYNHIPAAEAQGKLDDWNDLFKFSIVRNPWDMAVSWLYWYNHRSGRNLTLDQAFQAKGPHPWAANWATITINGQVAVDQVCRYERLEDDLQQILRSQGITYSGELPRAKANTAREGVGYRDVLQPRHAELISDVCKAEIAEFGYVY